MEDPALHIVPEAHKIGELHPIEHLYPTGHMEQLDEPTRFVNVPATQDSHLLDPS